MFWTSLWRPSRTADTQTHFVFMRIVLKIVIWLVEMIGTEGEQQERGSDTPNPELASGRRAAKYG